MEVADLDAISVQGQDAENHLHHNRYLGNCHAPPQLLHPELRVLVRAQRPHSREAVTDDDKPSPTSMKFDEWLPSGKQVQTYAPAVSEAK